MEIEAQEQHKKQKYDWLKGYQFVKGVSGNPNGRPKGVKSLKVFAREYLETLDDEHKIEFLKALPEELVWKMAEGNPETKTDVTSNGQTIVQISEAVAKKNNINDTPHTNTEQNS